MPSVNTNGAYRFPSGFLWGAATAAHQAEGNNVNSDLWVLEHVKPTLFAEPSGDACDHYHCYAEDIRLLAGLGFNTYRFSIEWARIEPEPGFFSAAQLDHYRRWRRATKTASSPWSRSTISVRRAGLRARAGGKAVCRGSIRALCGESGKTPGRFEQDQIEPA